MFQHLRVIPLPMNGLAQGILQMVCGTPTSRLAAYRAGQTYFIWRSRCVSGIQVLLLVKENYFGNSHRRPFCFITMESGSEVLCHVYPQSYFILRGIKICAMIVAGQI